jgi:hypothetical protein
MGPNVFRQQQYACVVNHEYYYACFLVTSSFEPTPLVAPWMRVRISKKQIGLLLNIIF